MKTLNILFLAIAFSIFLGGGIANANPLDLSGFSIFPAGNPGVSESGGTISFAEQSDVGGIYFWNPSFYVDLSAESVAFDYALIEDSYKMDYLVFKVNDSYQLEVSSISPDLSGSFSYDLTGFRGTTISLAFGLESDMDDQVYASSGTISNLKLVKSTTPIPEPGTLLCLSSGLLGLLWIRKRK
jgi:hypothetical protein